MDFQRYINRRMLPALGAVGVVLLAATAAHAANFETESEALILKAARWFQRIGSTLAVLAVMESGTRFFSEEKSQGARSHMKNVLIGAAIVFGAVGLVEILKASFSGKL